MKKIVALSFAALIIVVVIFAGKSFYTSIAYSQQNIEPDLQTGVYTTYDTQGNYFGSNIESLAQVSETIVPSVLSATTDNKRIEVDLATQRLYAFEGDRKIYEFIISSGKWNRTPTGTFRIWIKLRYTKMEGGSKALNTYYYLPNVPYVMFFANDKVPTWKGFGIHGTYWHNNFGQPMSHGCINMRTEDAEKIYYWANPVLGDKPSIKATERNPGTPVVIYGAAPSN
jgi:lipoprotein-anchoring transpeptidase ErfK/SrfK